MDSLGAIAITPDHHEPEVRAHVERVLESPCFKRSLRMRRMLQFLCDEMFSGRGSALKEYTIAVAAFDRPENFDPGSSAVVRVEAGRLRRLLDRYRAEYGENDRLILTVPKGSYCPVFALNNRHEEDEGKEDREGLAIHDQSRVSELISGGERRSVTVLSLEIISEAVASGADGSDALKTYDEAYDLCTSIAKRHGGTIDGGASDRIIIYFGWPNAPEDTAGRSMTAAIEIIAAMRNVGASNWVRMGIATSSVVARTSTNKPLIIGQAPTVATNMMLRSPRDGILVSENTRRLSRAPFEMIPAGSIENPHGGTTLAWRLLGPLSGHQRFRAGKTAIHRRLVGRQEEVDLLLSRWRLAMNGEGQTVILEGEAGIGKSRVAEAALRLMTPKGSQIRVQCSSHHTNSALYPCIELLRSIIAGDPARPIEMQVFATLLARFQINNPAFSNILAEMMYESDYGSTSALYASQKKELTHSLLLRILHAQTARRPTVLLVEDIHWADPTTLELIDEIIVTSAQTRLLVIVTGRPSASSRLARQNHATHLRLTRLPKSDSNLMIDEISLATPLPAEARSAIVEKAEGIPLFVEELTKAYLALDNAPLGRSAVPETLNDFLTFQLGRLGSARSVAQVAAVLGRDFSRDLLCAVTGETPQSISSALDQLLAAQILNQIKSGFQDIYSFRHALLRDAAYGSVLEADRRDLHYRAGTALVDSFPDISANHPEIVAEHMYEAGRHAEAIPFWIDAGRKAGNRYQLAEAIAHFRSALQALASISDDFDTRERELEVQLLLGSAVRNLQGYSNIELDPIYTRARDIAVELGRVESVANAVYGLWTYSAGRGQLVKASNLADDFQELARSIEDNGQVEIESARLLGASAALRGKFALARDHLERGLRLYDINEHGPSYGFDPGAVSAAYLAWTLWHLGEIEKSDRWAQRALFIAENKAHSPTLAMVLSWLIFHAVCRKDCDAIMRYNSRLQALCIERDCRYWQPFGAACAEWAEFQEDRSEKHLVKLLDYTAAFKEKYLISCLVILGATICVDSGRVQEGLRLAAQAQQLIIEHDERIWEAECSRIFGLLQLAQPNSVADGTANLRKAIRIARDQGAWELQRRAAEALEQHDRAANTASQEPPVTASDSGHQPQNLLGSGGRLRPAAATRDRYR